jgi:hypothetical protein
MVERKLVVILPRTWVPARPPPGVIRDAARSMLNLEPLIARLLEDVLRAIGSLTLEDLRDLMAPSPTASPRRSPAVPRVPVPSRRAKRRLPRRTVANSPPPSASDKGRATPPAIQEPPAGADITDPERLLATAGPPLPRGESDMRVDGEGEPPSSTVRPVGGSVVPLRTGETLASAPGSGVVIRRTKKA